MEAYTECKLELWVYDGFAYEYTYQDHGYIISTMNTIIIKARMVLIISLSLLQLHTRLQSVVQGIFIASSSGNANKLIN